ncbi:MAG: thioredoxin reductase [Moorea sp. SIOASIH]|uniref:VatD n=1 Tax=Moorena producens ASI16Jul14-2 TaxID=2546228 RepID=A0A4P8JDA4_9CYAN|nr:hypothetical protein [Moorena sp. SIOASIH]NEO38518.1 thioredoxin reductase [Moorena sp. SIOASIH]QCP68978.1 VatD [Moorena producens ASI16Jul14-2]
MIEVCIIGFGFSAVPLIRELQRTGTEFKIISEESNSVWDALSQSNRLDFDLVSSYLTSFYSFDLVKDFVEDYYPTSKQFYEMHQRWRKVYENEIIRDRVTRIDNFKEHSVIFTKSGKTLNAKHVICSTGFSRAIHTHINDIDYSVSNKTFVFDTMGDSANLIISKLIPNNNKIIIRTNGFNARDKVVPGAGAIYTLDQLEGHNFRYMSHEHYGSVIYGLPIGSKKPILMGDQFPVTVRDDNYITSKSRPASGTIAIKYWPIDQYADKFGNNLEESISQGYLLNDIAMWLHTGKAIVVPKDTAINFEKKTITYAGIERAFHQYIKGDPEQPRLPKIMIDGNTPYEYQYRDNFMGVIPRTLNNVYFIGYTRPYTGGLANIIEMQGLFVHKMITQSEFHQKIHHNLDERIVAYNNHYYGTTKPRSADHLVYFGFYTDDLARLIGIDYKPSEINSIKDMVFYYAFPNNALKYRLKGEYAVDGVEDLIKKINEKYYDFIDVFAYLWGTSKMDSVELTEELEQFIRQYFNDMRHKEPYTKFLENYIQVYRRVKNTRVDETDDYEWSLMVKKASETRDRVLQEFKESGDYQLEENFRNFISNEIELIQSLMNYKILSVKDGQLKIVPEKIGGHSILENILCKITKILGFQGIIESVLGKNEMLPKIEAQDLQSLLSLTKPKEYELLYLKP